MISLRADNRTLLNNAPFTYLVNNYQSGASTVTVANTTGITTDVFVLLSEFGRNDAEIFRVGTVNTSSGDIQLLDENANGTATEFAHPESTKVTVLAYNQIRFFWTPATGTIADETPVFSTSISLTGWNDITPDNTYTSFNDSTNSTGFGWFLFRNSVTTNNSTNSNPIPYAGFSANTVAEVFSEFDSMLNVKELSLVTYADKFHWLNEALAMIKNKLNLTNVEYTVSDTQTLTTSPTVQEYLLPTDFSEMVYIVDGDQNPVRAISLNHIGSYTLNAPRHYIRNRYIGILPLPTQAATYLWRYRAKAVRATGLSDYIDLPDNAFYSIKDWMMYRACLKFKDPQAQVYLQSFTNAVNMYMQAAVQRDADLDTWGIESSANT